MAYFKSIISKDELNALTLRAFTGDITVVDNQEGVKAAYDYLSQFDMIGFDTETRPSFKKGHINNVALLQLSTEKHAFLIRTCKIGLPDEIADILSNKKIAKLGVAIRDDIKGLQKWRKFIPGGFVELQDFVKNYGIEAAGLKKLTGIVMGFRISKSKQLSNWEEEELSHGQLVYGATDAWAGLLIYKKLLNTKINE